MAAPESRLGAGELEHRWHEALERVKDAAAPLAALEQRPVPLREEQRQPFRRLGQALHTVWHPAAAPEGRKKRLLRTVLPERVIETTQEPPEPILPLPGPGGRPPALRVSRHTAGTQGRATEHDIIALLRARSKGCRDLTLAATRNRLGSRPGTGKTWRAPRGACVRDQSRLPNGPQETAWGPRHQAAQPCGGRATVSKRLRPHGTVPARPGGAQAPWIIHRTALARVAVQAAVPRVRTGHRPRSRLSDRRESPGQAALDAGDPPAFSAPAETHRALLVARSARMAAVRLSRLQKRLLPGLAAEAQRTRWMSTRSHPELGAALPRAKGTIRHSLPRLERQGLIVMLRYGRWENGKRLSDRRRASAGHPHCGKC